MLEFLMEILGAYGIGIFIIINNRDWEGRVGGILWIAVCTAGMIVHWRRRSRKKEKRLT